MVLFVDIFFIYSHSFILFPPSITISDRLCFHLGVSSNGTSALCAGVGTELIKALGAHVLVVLLHILLPVQVVTAVVAVEAISHGGGKITPGTCTTHTRLSDSGHIELLQGWRFSVKHQMGTVLPFLSQPKFTEQCQLELEGPIQHLTLIYTYSMSDTR